MTTHRQRRRATARGLLTYLRQEQLACLVELPSGRLRVGSVPAHWHRVLDGLAPDLRRAQLAEDWEQNPWRQPNHETYLASLEPTA